MRLFIVFVALAALVLIPFFIWEEDFMNLFSQEEIIEWLDQYGRWAWLAAMVLLAGDLILPLPATLIMSALGFLYGPMWGGMIATLGTFLSGSLGFWLCRSFGESAARKILGREDYRKGRKWASGIGIWIVVLSRWLPVFPEVIACMAGLVGMPALNFHLALAAASIPLGFVYAYVGYTGVDNLKLAVLISLVLPPLIWLAIRPIFRSKLAQSSPKKPATGA